MRDPRGRTSDVERRQRAHGGPPAPRDGLSPHVERIRFLAQPIRDGLRHRHGFPALDGQFESSVPRLHFVGGMADRSYGPICRFVSGAGPTARRILAAARDTSV